MGSPEFALPTLRRLIESDHEVAGVVTQPDRPAGRGRGLRPPPAKELAQAHGLPVLQPERVNTPDALDELRALAPEAIVIAAYGQILKQPLLDLPARGILNVHASLLPKYRGATPAAAAILAGEETTGVTILEVRLALDGTAMAYSRQAIPYPKSRQVLFLRQMGLYVFRKEGLELFAERMPGPVERAEEVEMFRFLEHGYRVLMVEVDEHGISVDTEADLERARALMADES